MADLDNVGEESSSNSQDSSAKDEESLFAKDKNYKERTLEWLKKKRYGINTNLSI